MEAAQHIVKLGPVAVEVVDRTLIELARDIAMFRPVMETYVRGEPDALLLVEFAEDDQAENLRRLERLDELMGDLGHPNSVVKVADAAGQRAVWEVRASGLNIMMSMKSEGKPVSFIEDCAVPLEHLADYTERLTAIFAKHGTRGTWYAHASVGCLHVRPVLNLKLEKDANTMRAIAEEAFAHGESLQGLPFRRARRRAGALRVPRAHVRRQDGAPVRGGQGPLRSGGPDEPRQDRARSAHGRPHAVPLQARLPRAGDADGARLVGLPRRRRRVPGRGGDVQQQRRMPQARRRRNVSLVPRHRQRARRHARPRQRAAPRHLRPARS